MLAQFNQIVDACFTYEVALKRQNLKQEWVDELREMAKSSKCVPKIIDDRHVRANKVCVNKKLLNFYF